MLLYVGNSRGLERDLVPRDSIRAFFFPMSPPSTPRGLILLVMAVVRSMVVIMRARPAVTFATGGYVSVPAALASWLLRVPVVLFLPDIVPGKAVQLLAPLARRIATSTDTAAALLPANKTVVTGYPVRDAFRTARRNAGRERFGIPADGNVLCVFGGSQGSRSINQALSAWLPELLEQCHILHVCGPERYGEAQAAAIGLSSRARERYQLMPFLDEEDMAMALAASDLVVCRSGASTLGELPACGVPAVLVPLPAAGVHQRENARYLASHEAAVILEDAELESRLGETVAGLLRDRARLTAMAAACRALDRPDAAEAIAAVVLSEAA